MSIDLVPNIDDPDTWCPACGNLGWCELDGTTRLNGITYSRGSAPCKWCQQGRARYVRATSPPKGKHDHHRQWRPLERFTADDVIMVGDRDPRPARAGKPLVRELPGPEDAPVKDLEAGARRTYAAWRRVLPKELADAKLRQQTGRDGARLDRQVYPLELAAVVIAEYDALHPAPEPEEEEL